jgi:hypothetical protein
MRKFIIVLSVLLFAVTLSAQIRTGNIYGKIIDAEGNPLPGVSVTLTGPQMAPMTTVSGETGIYRFVMLSPNAQYDLAAELAGFKKETRTGIQVTVGSNVEINVTLAVGTIEEQITVVAQTPVIDTKKTTVGQMINKEVMQSLPTARDPWVMLQLTPGIMVDRENVGGNESTQQTGFLGKGDITGNIGRNPGANNIFAVDGIDISDPAALGGSALYYDFDMFEELNITTGGAADVSIQTGGIALNMVTRRGGNKTSLAGRFYLTDNFFQGNNLTDELRAAGIININKIQQIKDFGFNAGGPILKDKLWWWGAYGVQDIFIYNMYGTADKSILSNLNFKLNAQPLANNRFEALVTSGAKEKYGRNAGIQKPEGDHQIGMYHWGSPIIKLQDEHVFGNNVYVSLKYSFNDAGFGWAPIPDEATQYPVVMSQTLNKYVPYTSGMNASWAGYGVARPRNNYQVNASYFNDTFLGASHEIKLGAEYSNKKQNAANALRQGFQMTRQYNSLQLDVNGNGTRTVAEMAGWQRINLSRAAVSSSVADQYAGYIQDTITKGNFTVTLGLRYDLQKPSAGGVTRETTYPGTPAWDAVFDPAASPVLEGILPPITTEAVLGVPNIVNGAQHPYSWATWSPRIGFTWDVTGNGKTVAKLALSQFGDIMGVGWWANAPQGSGGSANFWWNDVNLDEKAQLTELYWRYNVASTVGTQYVPYNVFDSSGNLTAAATAALVAPNIYDSDVYKAGNLSGYDINNPLALDYVSGITDYFLNRSDQASTRTREILLTLEHELMSDLSASINLTYRRMDKMDLGMTYYPAAHSADYPDYTGPEVIDPRTPPAGGWYVEAGTVPDTYYIGDTTWNSGEAAGRPYYLPSVNWPTTATNYVLYRKSDAYNTYMGVDLVVVKRLSKNWFMNASLTLQDQKSYWGSDWFDPTNQWMSDGKTFSTNVGTLSGKAIGANMFTRWMVKFSGLYQLPLGFDVSATFNAREGWKIPHGFWILDEGAPNPVAGQWAWIATQQITKDSLDTFWNLTLRLEKKIDIGNGRLYLMADCFNVFNNNMINRAYDAYTGDAIYNAAGVQYDSWVNPTYRQYDEMLNPRIFRFGARFEF